VLAHKEKEIKTVRCRLRSARQSDWRQVHHVAIIMDGNGRWAKARGLPRVAGHRRGADAVRRVVRGAGELGIPVLTLFAFSTENWTRPVDEVSDLMGLLRHYLRNELEELQERRGCASLAIVTGTRYRARHCRC
jgi:undecaprenyl diphosphate synthase